MIPTTPGLKTLYEQPYDPKTYNALREDTVAFFKSNPADMAEAQS